MKPPADLTAVKDGDCKEFKKRVTFRTKNICPVFKYFGFSFIDQSETANWIKSQSCRPWDWLVTPGNPKSLWPPATAKRLKFKLLFGRWLASGNTHFPQRLPGGYQVVFRPVWLGLYWLAYRCLSIPPAIDCGRYGCPQLIITLFI